MDQPPLHFLFLLFLSVSLLPPSISDSNDIQSLLEFKKAIVDPTGTVLSSWAPPANSIQSCPSNWVGITCDAASGAVIGLNLSNLNLSGELKFSPLIGLHYIQTLSLAGNAFTGRLVPGLGSMTTLKSIDLSGNQFYGPVPDRITDLSGLEYLNLSGNNFTQGYPASLYKLQNLRHLDLRSNGIWGDIGELLSQLRNIEHVDLSGNSFTGAISVDPSNLTSLGNTVKYLNLSYNRIQGNFFSRESVGMFKNLEQLDLGYNALTGELPSLASWFNLRVLRLGSNQFFGLLPQEIFQSSFHLIEIDLSRNGFTGSLPNIISTTLKNLNLSSNSLSGTLPASIGSCVYLDLSNNQLTGDLTVLQNWGENLETIDLSSNALSGTYPESLSNFKNIATLKLSNTSLTGLLPSVLGTYPKLSVLDLSLNKLTGPILPSLFSSLTLTSLNLSRNGFNGSIPIQSSHSTESLVLSSYSHLEILDLSSNILTGNLPPDIGNIQGLRILNLGRNNLSGMLPPELAKLTLLEFLDLSGNRFTGPIPDLQQKALTYFNVSSNDLSGTVPRTLERFPYSSFFPGNPKLVFPDGVPTGNGNNLVGPGSGSRHMKSAVRVALIIGCVGSLILLIFAGIALYMIRSQELCGRHGFKSRDLKFGRSIFGSRSEGSVPAPISFSNDRLLTSHSRTMSAQKELLADAIEFGYAADPNSTPKEMGLQRSTPDMVELSSPNPVQASNQVQKPNRNLDPEPYPFEQVPEQQVDQTDRLVGDLTFLDSSVIFTAEELSRAPAEVLGRSSHGTTYKATLENGHVMTVKWLRVGLVKNKKEFLKEAKRVGSVRHPNVVSWRGFYWGPKEQERFIISDYLMGDSLSLYLYESTPRRYSRLSVLQRLRISIDLARALLYLHQEKNLPHGNIKPTNVLLTGPDLTAKLTDFGLHRLMTPTGITEQILQLGAVGYRAPELADAPKPVPSFKADVYAFGVVVMEMLTRKSAGEIISGQVGAVDLTDWVQLCSREGRGPDCFDRDITGLEENSRVLDELLQISLRCISPVNERPDMKVVVDELCSITI
ncbi:Leucine-rich receptor-like protein kinase family protein [Rhynchospora pubera]|uniref:Leucine-rich receptor-like protein kinase family protein n=1 Tax=Rhynchospora pubera TaxID=906938 RepID=A0AAV8DCZ1_9POAL|nr:Leucine-rich receptor-like protein kinase family protein [Rhynchospora pubera]